MLRWIANWRGSPSYVRGLRAFSTAAENAVSNYLPSGPEWTLAEGDQDLVDKVHPQVQVNLLCKNPSRNHSQRACITRLESERRLEKEDRDAVVYGKAARKASLDLRMEEMEGEAGTS